MSFSAPVAYHSPTSWVGTNLPPNERKLFEEIRRDINSLFQSVIKTKAVIISIVKKFNATADSLGMDESIPLLKQVVKYLRHILIDCTSAEVYLRLIRLLDNMIRKCGVRAHALIGRKRFLQTVSLTARRWKQKINNVHAQEAADYTFDCILAWHEAFYPIRHLFPFYSQTFYKLKFKYNVRFLRPENDPSRPVITLERVDENGNLVEDQVAEDYITLMSESMDSAGGSYYPDVSEQHVSYSVYTGYDVHNESFLGAPKPEDSTDNNSETKTLSDTDNLPPFQYTHPKEVKKSVVINDSVQYDGKPASPKHQIPSFRLEVAGNHRDDHDGDESNRPKSFRILGSTGDELSPIRPQPHDDSHRYSIGASSIMTNETYVSTDSQAKRRSKPPAFNQPMYSADQAQFANLSSENTTTTSSVTNHSGNQFPPGSPAFQHANSFHSQNSIDSRVSFQEKLERFNSNGRDDGSVMSSGSKGRRGSTSSTEKEKDVEIKFFGNQRIVKVTKSSNQMQ